MLSVAAVVSAAGAGRYYANDNYYTEGQLLETSAWFGRGAEALGLEGRVEPSRFEALLAGRLPNGETIADGRRGPHRPGFDLTFSAPKSVSLMAYLGGDTRLGEAHMAAVRAALAWAEARFAEGRATKARGGQETVGTGKLVAALFAHDTSRLLDPQMHVHAIIANVTQLPDGRWRALAERPIWEHKAVIASVYNAALRREVERLGYAIEASGTHGQFEIAGVPRAVIEAFSQRRQQIEAEAQKLAHRTPFALAAVALRTRGDKPRDIDRSELHAAWQARANALGFDPQRLVEAARARAEAGSEPWQRLVEGIRGVGAQARALAERLGLIDPAYPRDPLVPERPGRLSPDAYAAAQAIASAVRQLSEREAGFRVADLVKFALDKGAPVTVEHIEARVAHLVAKGLLVADGAGRMLTTAQALAAERAYLAAVEEGRGRSGPLLARDDQGRDGSARARDRAKAGGIRLNRGQLRAAGAILDRSDRTVHVQGVAGAGKSAMLKPVADLLQAEGRTVIGLGVSHAIANRLAADVGIATMTVARFLTRHRAALDRTAPAEKRQAAIAALRGAVLLVDEAGMLSTRDASGLVALANAADAARLVLVGDRRQLGAVEAGKPFAIAQGPDTVELTENLRARTPGMQAIHAAAQAHDMAALGRLLRPLATEAPGLEALTAAHQWIALSPEERARTALFVSGRALRAAVNAEVQRLRHQAGELGPAVTIRGALVPVHLTREEQKDPAVYQPGLVVELARPLGAQGLPAGLMEVTGRRRDGTVEVRLADGRSALFRPARLANNRVEDAVRLFEARALRLHAGDPVRWTGSDPARGLLSGDRATFTGRAGEALLFRTADDQEVRLARGDPMLKRLDLAYALNAHQAQGATAERAIVVARADEGRLITATNLAVLFTRAREEVHLVTDDLDRLIARADRQPGEKSSAIEVALTAEAPAQATLEPARPPEPAPSRSPARRPEREAHRDPHPRQPPVPEREREMEIGL